MRHSWKIFKRWLACIQECYANIVGGYLWEWLALQFSLCWTAKAHGKGDGHLLYHTSSRASAALEKQLLFAVVCIIHAIGRQQRVGHCSTEAQGLLNSNSSERLRIVPHLQSFGHRSARRFCCYISQLFGQEGSAVHCLNPNSFQWHNFFSPPCLCCCVRVGFPQGGISETILKLFLWWRKANLLKILCGSDKKSVDFSALAKIWDGIQPYFPDRRFMNI